MRVAAPLVGSVFLALACAGTARGDHTPAADYLRYVGFDLGFGDAYCVYVPTTRTT